MSAIKQVSIQEAKEIIDKREPRGRFYTIEGYSFIGIDNETGDAWTEEFSSLEICLEWLKGNFEKCLD
jgi:hypothetical protein